MSLQLTRHAFAAVDAGRSNDTDSEPNRVGAFVMLAWGHVSAVSPAPSTSVSPSSMAASAWTRSSAVAAAVACGGRFAPKPPSRRENTSACPSVELEWASSESR